MENKSKKSKLLVFKYKARKLRVIDIRKGENSHG